MNKPNARRVSTSLMCRINYFAYAYPGEQAAFPYRVRNIGESTATNVTVEMYDGDPAGSSGRLLGSALIPSITAGQSATGTFTATFSTEGPTDIYLRVDPLNQVLEADKTNNIVSRSFLVMTHYKPWDLSVDTNDLQLNPSRPHTGDTVQVSAAIHNNTEVKWMC